MSTLPWGAALAFLASFVILACVVVLLVSARRDPVKAEMRAMRKRRRKQRVYLRALQGPSPHTERNWFRDLKGLTK